MSEGELQCPARFVVCSDLVDSRVLSALAVERVAATWSYGPGPGARVDERLADADQVIAVLDELADQFRGECVVVALPEQVIAARSAELAESRADRQVTVLGD
ncbi:hypothetical protein ACQBAU_00860 [Propionibacteriaceae bacterium Y2011]|uniref:hypothetical protein n=1 Tax=Microlunatus sp. Y2014 TaxID=3418488 RepID=UPI003B4D79CF